MEQQIIDYLKTLCEPIAIILYGSQASGFAKPKSDWDVVVLSRESLGFVSTQINGAFIDIDSVVYPASVEDLMKKFDGTLQSSKVIFDTDSVGEDLLKEVKKIYANGKNLQPVELSRRIQFITRRLNKLEDNISDEVLFNIHLGVFADKAIQYWFEILNNRWRTSLGTALGIITNEDANYALLLKRLFEDISLSDKYQTAQKIHSILCK